MAQQLAGLLNEKNQKLLHKFDNNRNVSVDLSNVKLPGQNWPRIDFSWVGGAYLYGIDLRDANLTNSKWGNATLPSASLQCANLAESKFNKLDKGGELSASNLRGAHLQHTNLQNADLRSADLTDADLTGAYIDGARFDGAQLDRAATNGVIGVSVGDGDLLRGDPKREEFDVQRCKRNGWDK